MPHHDGTTALNIRYTNFRELEDCPVGESRARAWLSPLIDASNKLQDPGRDYLRLLVACQIEQPVEVIVLLYARRLMATWSEAVGPVSYITAGPVLPGESPHFGKKIM